MRLAIVKCTLVLSSLPFILIGCAATSEKPVQELARAESGIEQAEDAGARKYGVVELDDAREKFQRAQDATRSGDHDTATRLAREAALDAELATAMASTRKTQKAADELERGIQTLQDEIERSRNSRN